MDNSYWKRQEPGKNLYPDIEWSKPEQRSQAGKLLIIGGNKMGFASVAVAYDDAVRQGAGTVRILLPDALSKAIPTTITDTVYVPTNPSGGMSREAENLVLAAQSWADVSLLIGDTGRNSETAILLETTLTKLDGWAVITRDAVDLLNAASAQLVDRDKTVFVVSFAQLQKLFKAVYYPKILSFSMQLMQLVETLHKFTLTYPCTVMTYHQEQLIVAHGGNVTTTVFNEPMAIWRGTVATKAACYLLWNPGKPLEAITASLLA